MPPLSLTSRPGQSEPSPTAARYSSTATSHPPSSSSGPGFGEVGDAHDPLPATRSNNPDKSLRDEFTVGSCCGGGSEFAAIGRYWSTAHRQEQCEVDELDGGEWPV